MQIPRRMVSAEPGIARHNTKTLLHDLNILFYSPMKFQVLWCTHIEGMKKSTNLCDILQFSSMGIESPHHASAVVVQSVVWLSVTKILQLPTFWTVLSGFCLTHLLHTPFKY